MKRINKWKITAILILLVSVLPVGHYVSAHVMGHNGDMDEKRAAFISLKEDMQHDLMPDGGYRCCLEKACTYCIEKDPKHGEGAACDCLADIVNGKHPCGECIGEILEGHGNPYLAEYFPAAIAEEVGEQHLETLEKIIEEKYGVSFD